MNQEASYGSMFLLSTNTIRKAVKSKWSVVNHSSTPSVSMLPKAHRKKIGNHGRGCHTPYVDRPGVATSAKQFVIDSPSILFLYIIPKNSFTKFRMEWYSARWDHSKYVLIFWFEHVYVLWYMDNLNTIMWIFSWTGGGGLIHNMVSITPTYNLYNLHIFLKII